MTRDIEEIREILETDCNSDKKCEMISNIVNGKPHYFKEPKTGHWINKQHLFDSCSAECSSCHKRSNGYMHDNGFSIVSKYYDYCPQCGARMSEVGE